MPKPSSAPVRRRRYVRDFGEEAVLVELLDELDVEGVAGLAGSWVRSR